MISIGIDQSFSSTGVVVVDDGVMVHYEVITAEGKNENPVTAAKRAKVISNKIVDVLDRFKPDRVVLEGLGFGSFGDATRDLAGLQMVLMVDIINSGFHDPIIVPPTSLKKRASGKGKATKKEMFGALPDNIRDVFGKIPASKGRYDLTDAFFLAVYDL